MSLTLSLAFIVLGLVLLVWSADRLVAGASALARNFGISPLIVGVTIVGFGTSAPELVVSALAALEGNPSLAIGNALGSNIANIALILGLTGMVYPMTVEPSTLRREIPMLAFVSAVTAVMMFNLELSRLEGAIMALGLFLFLGSMIIQGRKGLESDPATLALINEISDTMPTRHAVLWSIAGLMVLPLSAQLLVTGAIGLAEILGVPEAVIGLTVVALGTSLPELAAAVASALRKEDDLCIGNILGSNMFNLLGVLGIAALIHPMEIDRILLVRDVPVMIFTFLALSGMALFLGRVGRGSAGLLLLTYVIYQLAVFWHALV